MNEPSEFSLQSFDLAEKGQNCRFLRPRSLKITLEKKNERQNKKSEENNNNRGSRKKKAIIALLKVSYCYIGASYIILNENKNHLAEELVGGNVFKIRTRFICDSFSCNGIIIHDYSGKNYLCSLHLCCLARSGSVNFFS